MKLGPRLSTIVGFTSGWNIFDTPTGNSSGLLGLKWNSMDKRRSLSFTIHSGEDTMRDGDHRTHYALTYQRKMNRRLQFAVEHNLGYEKNGATDVFTDRRGPARWISLAQYVQYQWSDNLSFGVRAEWFRDDGHSRILKNLVSMSEWEFSGHDYYEVTLGANWKPTRCITIRPEVRYDWSNVKVDGRGGVYSGFTKNDILSFGIDGVIRF